MIGTPDPTAPDLGPRPEEENLTPDQIIAKWGDDLPDDAAIAATIMAELVFKRKLDIAVDRKTTAERQADEAWMSAYIKRYGTDEG